MQDIYIKHAMCDWCLESATVAKIQITEDTAQICGNCIREVYYEIEEAELITDDYV